MNVDLDDETLQIFLEESREHMDGIETDLLTIEELGANIDDDLVNKVFRAVHSVKGGAGFFAFDQIKNLAHAMENLLGLIRKHELVPTSQIVSLLLSSADTLTQMIHSPESMDAIDTADQLVALKAALTGNLPEEKKETVEKMVDIRYPGDHLLFQVSEFEMENAKQAENGGAYIYLLEFDLIKDIQHKGKTPWEVVSDLLKMSAFIESKLDIEAVSTLDVFSDEISIPFFALLATDMEPGVVEQLLDLRLDQIHQIQGPPPEESAEQAAAGSVDTQGVEFNGPAVPVPAEPVKTVAQAKALTPVPVPHVKSAPEPEAVPAFVPVIEPAAAPAAAAGGPPLAAGKGAQKVSAEGSIRVNVKVIDSLMNLAGELVLARNQLMQGVISHSMNSIEAVSQRVDLVTTELQDTIMTTRMQSIGIVFNKFKRIVRDMAKTLNKKVDLVLEGEDVELDKTIIEAISDPLTHLVRNSVDHGIETPADRLKAGKPEEGTLKLSASHKAGQVLIEIWDDGGGINTTAVREKAISMGLYNAAQLDEMSEQAIVRLIFHPGFSTAKKVTDVSGRGVGMDVVHSNLSKLGGVVDIDTTQGKGTTMRITLPLTLAIIPSLLVSDGQEHFAIPQHNLVELVRISAAEIAKKIEKIGDAAVMRLRGELLPLVRLSDVLEIRKRSYRRWDSDEILPDARVNIADRRSTPKKAAKAGEGAAEAVELAVAEEEQALKGQKEPENSVGADRRQSIDSAVNIAVVAAGEFHYGLIVENLLDSAEIVVKPLGNHLRDCRVYAGATILGDGHVALILDVLGISQKLRARSDKTLEREQDILSQKETRESGDLQSLLIVENGLDEQFAIPLGLVERIERIHQSQIQDLGSKRAMQYRNTNLRLLSIEDVAMVAPRDEAESLYVIVFKVGDREAGLMVSKILDTMNVLIEVDEITHKQPGIFGSVILDGVTTLLLDPQGIIHTLMPEWNMAHQAHSDSMAFNQEEGEAKSGPRTVMVVEDSRFFLNQIKGFMEDAGYSSLCAENGVEALEVLEQHLDQIDLVLTDIEMPEMDGFTLTERMRADERFVNIPVVAVTSVMDPDAQERGKAVGIDEYLIKLDREQILERSRYFLEHGRQV
ncbi:MAG: chemotaxis protein CheW [Planctomycetota bacterium]